MDHERCTRGSRRTGPDGIESRRLSSASPDLPEAPDPQGRDPYKEIGCTRGSRTVGGRQGALPRPRAPHAPPVPGRCRPGARRVTGPLLRNGPEPRPYPGEAERPKTCGTAPIAGPPQEGVTDRLLLNLPGAGANPRRRSSGKATWTDGHQRPAELRDGAGRNPCPPRASLSKSRSSHDLHPHAKVSSAAPAPCLQVIYKSHADGGTRLFSKRRATPAPRTGLILPCLS
jgi:hypothetical protein